MINIATATIEMYVAVDSNVAQVEVPMDDVVRMEEREGRYQLICDRSNATSVTSATARRWTKARKVDIHKISKLSQALSVMLGDENDTFWTRINKQKKRT